jgi:hypothetical protein
MGCSHCHSDNVDDTINKQMEDGIEDITNSRFGCKLCEGRKQFDCERCADEQKRWFPVTVPMPAIMNILQQNKLLLRQ